MRSAGPPVGDPRAAQPLSNRAVREWPARISSTVQLPAVMLRGLHLELHMALGATTFLGMGSRPRHSPRLRRAACLFLFSAAGCDGCGPATYKLEDTTPHLRSGEVGPFDDELAPRPLALGSEVTYRVRTCTDGGSLPVSVASAVAQGPLMVEVADGADLIVRADEEGTSSIDVELTDDSATFELEVRAVDRARLAPAAWLPMDPAAWPDTLAVLREATIDVELEFLDREGQLLTGRFEVDWQGVGTEVSAESTHLVSVLGLDGELAVDVPSQQLALSLPIEAIELDQIDGLQVVVNGEVVDDDQASITVGAWDIAVLSGVSTHNGLWVAGVEQERQLETRSGADLDIDILDCPWLPGDEVCFYPLGESGEFDITLARGPHEGTVRLVVRE